MAACAAHCKESDSFSISIGYIKTLNDLNIVQSHRRDFESALTRHCNIKGLRFCSSHSVNQSLQLWTATTEYFAPKKSLQDKKLCYAKDVTSGNIGDARLA